MSQEATNPELQDTNNENFADMLDNFIGNSEKEINQVIEGEIVEIRDNAEEKTVLIGIGEKMEPYISLSEIQDKDGKTLFAKGDKIKVVIVSKKGGNIRVSYTKYLEQEATRKYIEEKGVENIEGEVINGSIKSTSKKGYTIEQNGVLFFMPHTQAFLLKRGETVGNRRLQSDKKVRAKVIKVDADKNLIIVSRKRFIQNEIKKRQEFIGIALEKPSIQARIIAITKEKLIVDVEGMMKGYISAEEISHRGKVNPFRTNRVRDVIEAKVLNYDEKERVFNMSIKAITVDPWLEIQEQIESGDIIEVTVSNIESYGAFVDIGNDAEGFLHVSEIAWEKKISHPKDFLTVGDSIEVEVVEVDPEAHRLRVSRKRLLPKPFDLFKQNYKRGQVVTGKVTNLTDFGAFVRIGEVEGLLRNSDLNWTLGSKCKDELKIGDEIEVKIFDIDMEREKISLSRKALLETPIQEFAKTNKVGDIVKGVIRDVKEFGAFVTIGENVDALIRTEDMTPQNKEEFAKGVEVEGMIITLDTRRDRIRLSIRRLERAKEQQLLKEINAENDDTRNSTLGDLLKDKLQ
jgi:small subunit ribosomal protein S1